MYFIYKGQPHELLEAKHLMLGRGGGMLQVKFKNLRTGSMLSETFKGADKFQEADVTKNKITFIYSHRGTSIFSLSDTPSKRFEISENLLELGFHIV